MSHCYFCKTTDSTFTFKKQPKTKSLVPVCLSCLITVYNQPQNIPVYKTRPIDPEIWREYARIKNSQVIKNYAGGGNG